MLLLVYCYAVHSVSKCVKEMVLRRCLCSLVRCSGAGPCLGADAALRLGCRRRRVLLCSLFEGQQCFNVVDVALGYQAEVGQVAFLLLGLFGQDVALVSMFSFDLS